MGVSILYCFPFQGTRDTESIFSTQPMVACFQPTNVLLASNQRAACIQPTRGLRASNQPMVACFQLTKGLLATKERLVACFQATNSPGFPRVPLGSPGFPGFPENPGNPGSADMPRGPALATTSPCHYKMMLFHDKTLIFAISRKLDFSFISFVNPL